MGRGDSRRTSKMRRKTRQRKLKARTARKVAAAKAAKGPSTPTKTAAAPKKRVKKAES